MHINACLDTELAPLLQQLSSSSPLQPSGCSNYLKASQAILPAEPSSPVESVDTTGMPDYDQMPVSQLRSEMDKLGMKKSVEVETCRSVLKQVWLYQNRGVFPLFLAHFL
jgi:hypothetical protein